VEQKLRSLNVPPSSAADALQTQILLLRAAGSEKNLAPCQCGKRWTFCATTPTVFHLTIALQAK
jgi:hypothetical protein